MLVSQETIDEITEETSMLALSQSGDFDSAFDENISALVRVHNQGDADQQQQVVKALVDLAADISPNSYIPEWTLKHSKYEPRFSYDDMAGRNQRILGTIIDLNPNSLIDLAKEVTRINGNGLRQLTHASDKGPIHFAWLNDYAAGLREAMRIGASGATTNPVLVKLAAEGNPTYWNSKLAKIIDATPNSSGLERALEITVQVVAENCKRMMPVYKATSGSAGYISLQLDPRNANDAKKTFEDASLIYKKMQDVLGTDTPNMVFKVAGTAAGYEAAERITTELGCGVNVTVNYTLPQQLEFGNMLEGGPAEFNYLTEMNGRFNKPVQQQLEALGYDSSQIAEAAASEASRIVVQRAYETLHRVGEKEKTTLLLASMRGPGDVLNYLVEGDHPIHYTVFPNVQGMFDGMNLTEDQIRETLFDPVEQRYLDILGKSELFVKGTSPQGIKIADFEKLPCAQNTLNQFADAMGQMIVYCKAGSFEKAGK